MVNQSIMKKKVPNLEDSLPICEGFENLRGSFASFLVRKARQERAKSAIYRHHRTN